MFMFFKNLENISVFQVKNKKIVYLSNSGLFTKALYIDDIKVFDNKVSNFIFDGKIIVFSVWHSHIYIVDIEGLVPQILIENYSFGSLRNSDNEMVVGNVDLGDTWLYNFIERYFVKELHEPPSIKIDTSLIFNTQATLRSLSLLTGEYDWGVDLGGRRYLDDSRQEKIASITQVLGIWENQLLVVMDSGELISIDIHTGQLLWNKADIYTHTLSSFPNRSQFWRSYWHLENGYLYQLDGNVYYRVSLTTQALEILWQDTKQNAYLTFSHKTFTEEYVYFTGSYNRDLSPYLLGVFNRKTLQIDWLYDFGNQLAHEKGDYPHSLNQPPQVAENKLYVLDSGGTLHIFEREE